ncbi:hypothetical protein Esti_002299 [Eimeria stiedai]
MAKSPSPKANEQRPQEERPNTPSRSKPQPVSAVGLSKNAKREIIHPGGSTPEGGSAQVPDDSEARDTQTQRNVLGRGRHHCPEFTLADSGTYHEHCLDANFFTSYRLKGFTPCAQYFVWPQSRRMANEGPRLHTDLCLRRAHFTNGRRWPMSTLITTGCRDNSAKLSLSADSQYAAQALLYSIADDDDSVWGSEATRALQLDKGDYPDIFDYSNRHKRSRNNDPRFACLECSTDLSQIPKTFDVVLQICDSAEARLSQAEREQIKQLCLYYPDIWNAGDRPIATANLTKFVVTLKDGLNLTAILHVPNLPTNGSSSLWRYRRALTQEFTSQVNLLGEHLLS